MDENFNTQKLMQLSTINFIARQSGKKNRDLASNKLSPACSFSLV